MRFVFFLIILVPILGSCDDKKSDKNLSVISQVQLNTSPNPYDAKQPAPSGYTLPSGNLKNIDLSNWAKLQRDQTHGDAFTNKFDDKPIAGREFTVTIPLSQYNDETAAVWRYDTEKEELLLELDMEYTADMKGQMAVFQSAKDTGQTKQMSNALGVTVDVAQSTVWSIGIGTTSGYAGIIPIDDLTSTRNQKTYGFLTSTIRIPGDQARRAVSGMTLIIEGVIQKNKSGNTVECSERTTEPKIDQPSETTLRTCLIQSSFKRIAFVTKDGKALKEWRR